MGSTLVLAVPALTSNMMQGVKSLPFSERLLGCETDSVLLPAPSISLHRVRTICKRERNR